MEAYWWSADNELCMCSLISVVLELSCSLSMEVGKSGHLSKLWWEQCVSLHGMNISYHPTELMRAGRPRPHLLLWAIQFPPEAAVPKACQEHGQTLWWRAAWFPSISPAGARSFLIFVALNIMLTYVTPVAPKAGGSTWEGCDKTRWGTTCLCCPGNVSLGPNSKHGDGLCIFC